MNKTAISEPQNKTHDKLKTFSELSVSKLLKQNIENAGFNTPTPVQAVALPPALEGRDILGTAQTGTGKTLAFALPILERLMQSRGRQVEALVLLPTRELAMQVLETMKLVGRGSGILATLVVGGLSESRQLEEINRGARLIIATPGRLNDYIERRLVDLRSVKILVLDEADRMVDMGFLPQMKRIMNVIPKERQTMCFSATLDSSVAHLVHQYLHDPVRVEIGSTIRPAESVDLKIYEVIREQKFSLLTHLLNIEPGTFLIFCRTKHGADKLAKKLAQGGFDASAIHGNKSQSQRTRALEGFKAQRPRILVATDIAARGIHVDKIAHVINYDMPQAPEDFIHRVGRTGRVEESGVATTFVMPEEIHDIKIIERKLGRTIERVPVPAGLPVGPRSLYDETMDMRSRRAFNSGGPRHFRRRKRF
ncbi:MAG: DEAD/DEAH box helicase [bacterium]|nr:DEAD/DEAH box helicase [bacterium]